MLQANLMVVFVHEQVLVHCLFYVARLLLAELNELCTYASHICCNLHVCFSQVSAFYVSPNPPNYLVRFVFCKTQDKLTNACELLEKYFSSR